MAAPVTAQIIPFPLERRRRRPALSPGDLRAVEAHYDALGPQAAEGPWRGFAALGSTAVLLFTSYDHCPALALRRDSAGAYELAQLDGQVVRRGDSVGQLLRVLAPPPDRGDVEVMP